MEISSTVNESSNYDAGLAAYHRGHYEVAMYDFESRAIKGDPVAQFCLGFMYKHGKGVPHNREKAIAWYTKAAEQGYAPAQNDPRCNVFTSLGRTSAPRGEISKYGLSHPSS